MRRTLPPVLLAGLMLAAAAAPVWASDGPARELELAPESLDAAQPGTAEPGQPELGAGPGQTQTDQPKPPPIHVDYAIFGAAFAADILADAGATCAEEDEGVPCILGSGGGVIVRGGYRSPGPWYIGGAYQFSKTDSGNLYRLGIMQQLRVEMRYMFDLGYRVGPYATWGLGGMVYGNEWGVDTGGGALVVGVGVELQLSRLAVLGMAVSYQPMLIAGWTDTAGFERDAGFAQYIRIELQLEIRSQLARQ